MSVNDHSYEEYKAFLQQHKGTIVQVAALFYNPENYCYHEMVCDLITYLWELYCEMTPKMGIRDESAWVYTVVYRKALNLHRGESRRQGHYVYDADLSNLADDREHNHHIDRLYHLIDLLDNDDQDLVFMYLNKVPTSHIANFYGTSPLNIRRRLKKICDKLRHLDSTVDEDDDFDL